MCALCEAWPLRPLTREWCLLCVRCAGISPVSVPSLSVATEDAEGALVRVRVCDAVAAQRTRYGWKVPRDRNSTQRTLHSKR